MEVTKRNENLPVSITVEGISMKQVTKFRYLGSLMIEEGKCDAEIKARIGMAEANFGKMRDLLTNLKLNTQLRERMVRCYIWSGAAFIHPSYLPALS